MSLFTSETNPKSGLRHQFESFVHGDFAAATSAANAVYIGALRNTTTFLWFENSLSYVPVDKTVSVGNDIMIYAVHPKADIGQVENRLPWIEIGGFRTINYNVGLSPHIRFEAQTKFFASYITGDAPSAGFLRMYVW